MGKNNAAITVSAVRRRKTDWILWIIGLAIFFEGHKFIELHVNQYPGEMFLVSSFFTDFCGMRYFLDIVYDGTSYHGWQEQDNAISVQQTINEALSTLLKVPTKCVGSGRTDTGVHALQQIVHIEVDKPLTADQLAYKLNRILPGDIAVKRVMPVHDDAHAAL